MSTVGQAMPCEECGGETVVTDSRSHALGIKRNRRCSNGHSFPTLEVRARRLKAGERGDGEHRLTPEDLPSYRQARALFMQH